MKIGIIGAMDVEVRELKAKIANAKITEKAGLEFVEGTIGSTDVVVVKCGIGKVNAGICVQILVDLFEVTHVLNTGIAGSLKQEINVGDIVISTEAAYHDMDVTIFGYQMGEVPGIGVPAFPADEKLRRAAVTAVREAAPDIQVFEGGVVSGDQFIGSHAQKDAIIAKFPQAYCTEMEGCAIAHAAYANQIPFVVVRAISDKADDSSSVTYEEFEAKAAVDCAHVVEYMIAHYADFS